MKRLTAYQIGLKEHVRRLMRHSHYGDFELLKVRRTDIQEGAIFAVILGVFVWLMFALGAAIGGCNGSL